jgi:hypothetical protein
VSPRACRDNSVTVAAIARSSFFSRVPCSCSVLNIYGLSCPLTSDLHLVAQDCVSLRLGFVPFKLTHSSLLLGWRGRADNTAPDIILAGGDCSVHVYRFSGGSYTEESLSSPEHPLGMLRNTPAAVLSLDLVCTASGPTPTALLVAGCQDGLVRFASLRTEENEQQQTEGGSSWKLGADSDSSPECPNDAWTDFYLDGPVCSATFFSPSSHFLCDVFPSREDAKEPLNDNELNRMQRRAFDACVDKRGPEDEAHDGRRRRRSSNGQSPEVRLLMANAVGFGAVYG